MKEPKAEIARFQPAPGSVYSLDHTARLAGVTRRTVILYCRAGYVEPIVDPPFGALYFNDQAVSLIRRMEHIREQFEVGLLKARMIFDLFQELEWTRRRLHLFEENYNA